MLEVNLYQLTNMTNDRAFLEKLEAIVRENYRDEQFGVSDLVDLCGMDQTELHDKLESSSGRSISQFIRDFRLEESYKLLRDKDYLVSEVAQEVGFNSEQYFKTCFKDYFGYQPGEVRHMAIEEQPRDHDLGETTASPLKNRRLLIYVLFIVVFIMAYFIVKWMKQS